MALSSHKANKDARGLFAGQRVDFAGLPALRFAMRLRLKELRKARGWTQEQLADVIGVTKSHVSEMETGKKNPSQPTLDRLAQAFGMRVSGLLARDGQDADAIEMMERFEQLSEDQRKMVLAMVSGLLADKG